MFMGVLARDEAEAAFGGLGLERGRGDGGEGAGFERSHDPVRLTLDDAAIGGEPLEAHIDDLAKVGAVAEIELDASDD